MLIDIIDYLWVIFFIIIVILIGYLRIVLDFI